MKHNLHISNRLFSTIFFAVLMLCATNAWAIDFTPTQIAAGTTTSGITVSSSFSKSTGKKLCTTKTSEDAISMSNSAGSTYNDKYLWITVPANCKITDVSVLTKSNGDSEVTGAAIFWSGAAAATGVTSTATISAGARNTADCTGAIDLSVPSNTRTVGLYRAPKIKNGAFDNGGSAVGGTSTFNVFSLSVTAICPVNHVLTNATKSSGETTATLGSNYSATYAAPDGYTLPSDITVKVGSTTQTKGTHYTWTVSAGVGSLSITGTYVADSITVIVTGEAVATCVAPTSVGISGTKSYTEGETITLTAAATGGSGTETYQWYKGGTAEVNKIAGATNATYTKASCTTADAGNYYCEISTGSTCSTFSSACAVSVAALPAGTMVYLKPNANWLEKDGSGVDPRFAVYYFKSSNTGDNGWVSMTAADGGCAPSYKVVIPDGYDKCIFCRMNGATSENKWDNKYNQTGDLTVPTGNAIFYAVPAGWWDTSGDTYWQQAPLGVCVSGTWLRFTGETITLTATCAGATNFQWYKGGTGESNKITGATSATYTKTNCTIDDVGNYYCKAWKVAGQEATSEAIGVKIPYLEYQTPGDGSDYRRVALTRTGENEWAQCSVYPGVAWEYEFAINDGFTRYGNSGKKTRDNSTEKWTMSTSPSWCRWSTDKEGTYHFYIDFKNATLTPILANIVYPPMAQSGGHHLYMEKTSEMVTAGWDKIFYRIGKGKYGDSDLRNYATAQLMTLVPGTARFYETTTPEWTANFWAWHIANNCGSQGDGFAIYQTHSSSEYEITQSINFDGDEIENDSTYYVHISSGDATGGDWLNNNCTFRGHSATVGMLQHNLSVGATTNGKLRIEYTHYDNTSQSSEASTARNFNGLAHTCIITITGVPDCGYRIATLTVNGVPFSSGSDLILTENATVAATFTDDTYSVTLNTNGGTINSGNVTSYVHGTGATLPTDITLAGKDFTGWYDNAGCMGAAVTEITTSDCGNKTYYAGWEDHVATFQYVLGSCYIKSGMWTQGSDGSVGAYRFVPGADVASNNLVATTDISISTTSSSGVYFNTKDLTKLDTESSWGTSSTSNRAIKAIKVSSNSTVTFDLGSLEAKKITYYVFPGSNDDYTVDLTVNGATSSKSYSSDKDKWHKYEYKGTFTGEFSITSNSKESRVVVIVEIPKVTITFDANGGSGTMTPQEALKGSTVELNPNEFTRSGYTFLGWTEDPAGTGTLILDEADYDATADVTLYAKWEEIIHTTITLDATGAFNAYTTSVIATYHMPMPEIAVLPQRAGYVFDGYYTEPNGAGVQYYTGLGAGVRNWDKTDPTYTLYAKWLEPCDLVPTLTNVTPVVTIWDKKKVDVGVVKLTCDFDTTGITYSLKSAVTSEPLTGDLHFEYFDEQIHLMGTSNFGNSTVKTITVTFTIKNSCDPEHTYTITSTIRVYPETQKAKIAFIVTGTKGGSFTACTASDVSSCSDLVDYLDDYFDITFVNGYATQDPAAIENYYRNYDLMVVTDFLNTGAGYTNALGTMIDKKPILSFEAYVAGLSNWHIASNPKDPKPKVQDMKVLCAGHAIFKDAKFNPGDAVETEVVRSDTTVNVLSSLSSAEKAKGLQGFTISEAPDFIFLATVRDANNNRDLIVCCERQVVFPARLLIYGINFYEMPNLSNAGKIIMRQMIDYLLMTDETKVADCSLVFDNGAGNPSGGGDHLWSNPANWAPGYNIIPTPYHPTRIIAECHVNIEDAHAGSVKVNKGRDEHDQPVDGKLIVKPYGGLTIAGMVATVHDTRYASPITIKAEDLLIEADETRNGGFVYGNKESDVRATVQYYSRGEGAYTSTPVWQYMGIPFQAGQTAIKMYYAAWMCRWAEGSTDGLGGLWQWVNNEDVLLPFEGYAITQENKKTYEFAGKLNSPTTKILTLDNRDGEGFAFAANSWTAPIKIQEMQDADFTNAEKTIYIYHSGSYADWTTNGDPVSAVTPGSAATLPGQYASIPIHSSPYISGADSVIPAMQGFFVQTTAADAKLKLVYNKVVYDAKYFKTSTQPMRAPRRSNNGGVEKMQIMVCGANYGGDQVHLLARGDFSEGYEDGWDGRKLEGDTAFVPYLAVVKEAGNMSVAAINDLDDRFLSFRAGKDTEYTFSFNYEGETIYLYDIVTQLVTEIRTGNTYSFTATNKSPLERFLITTHPPRITTDINNSEWMNGEGVNGVKKFIYEGKIYILSDGIVYDAIGQRVDIGKEVAQ